MPWKIAFYADIFYQSVRSPEYWIPPANLDVQAILLGGDIHYRPELLGQMLASIRKTQADTTRLGDNCLTFRDCNELHREARDFIDGQLRALSQAERDKTIVCTHYWPTLRPWAGPGAPPEPEWLNVYGTDLDALIADHGPRLWLCGHVHESHRVMIGATEVASNPRAGDGPGNLNPDFLESYVVEL